MSYHDSFFHAVFARAACYTAMLMTVWGSGEGASKDQIGVGWASVWVKMASQWLTVALYMCGARLLASCQAYLVGVPRPGPEG